MGWAEKNRQSQERHMRGILSDFCRETFEKMSDESEAVESFTKSFNALCAFAKVYATLYDKDPRAVVAELLLEVFEECEKVDSEDSDGACGRDLAPNAFEMQRPSDPSLGGHGL